MNAHEASKEIFCCVWISLSMKYTMKKIMVPHIQSHITLSCGLVAIHSRFHVWSSIYLFVLWEMHWRIANDVIIQHIQTYIAFCLKRDRAKNIEKWEGDKTLFLRLRNTHWVLSFVLTCIIVNNSLMRIKAYQEITYF